MTINPSYRELTFDYLVPGWDGGQNNVFLTEFKKCVLSTCDNLQGGAVLGILYWETLSAFANLLDLASCHRREHGKIKLTRLKTMKI